MCIHAEAPFFETCIASTSLIRSNKIYKHRMEEAKCILAGHFNCADDCPGRLREKRRLAREKRGDPPLQPSWAREQRQGGDNARDDMEEAKCILTGHFDCATDCPGRFRERRRLAREKRGDPPLRAPRTREQRQEGYRVRDEMNKIMDQCKLNPHFPLESNNPHVIFDKSSRAYKQHMQGQRETKLEKDSRKFVNRVKGLWKREDNMDF